GHKAPGAGRLRARSIVVAMHRPPAAMPVDDVLAQALAEEDLRLAAVNWMRHEADDVERQLRERAAHLVETVLGLDDDLVEAVIHRPHFLLFGEGAEVALAAPVLACPADPLVEDPTIPELDDVLELEDQVGKLGIGFRPSELVGD